MSRLLNKLKRAIPGITVTSLLGVGTFAYADDDRVYYSPPTATDYPTEVLWGDTHLHTSLSVDSSARGNARLTPDMAYRFAKGRSVRANNGEEYKLSRPLDFLVIADHAVNLGVFPRVLEQDPLVMNTDVGRQWYEHWKEYGWSANDALNADTFEEWKAAVDRITVSSQEPEAFFWWAWLDQYVGDPAVRRSVWNEVCHKADEYNEPGVFTAFIGFEWTPAEADDRAPNLHRNVLFKGDSSSACQVLPFSTQDSQNVEDLWAYLADYEAKTGDSVLAIPHNGNQTRGNLFGPTDYFDEPLDMDYLKARRRWEPLVEVTQIKGDSETHPLISPTDEFADFERWPPVRPHSAELAQYEYARAGLKWGLDYQADTGVNPYKFGMIGSTDSHTGMVAVAEDNFGGNYALIEPSPYRAIGTWWFSASGLAAVWATGNTRAEIFEAMQRRETYGTTGPRISLRVFAGWDFEEDDATSSRFVDIGYREGVPMGGDLVAAPEGRAPRFMIRAVKDEAGANLDRVQVIKGWRDRAGELHEKIYDVALSDGREARPGERPVPVGNTVDVETATYQNTIGDPELAVVWEDPDFNADELAFYYVRVLEIPTPRWTTYDAAYYGTLEILPKRAKRTVQERAYGSPIWYTP